MSIKQTSLVWEFFTENGDWVICTKCPKAYKLATAKSSTQPLRYHLKTKHSVDYSNAERAILSKRPAEPENSFLPPSKKQKTLFSYTEKKSQQQMYAELAAVDRLSFQQIASSNFIRNAMLKEGLKSHTSPNTIKDKVYQYYNEAKDIVIDHLQKKIKENCRFALSFDEYTGKNRRYLTINVHSENGVCYNLGMVRVWNSQTAETVLKLVELRLADFKMNFDHITAMVTDGASIMVKLGRLTPCEHVVCLSHTLHLVITDVFYPKKKSDSGEDEEELIPDTPDRDDESEDEDEDDEEAPLPNPTRVGNPRSLAASIGPVVKKVRVIIKKFRCSPVKNDSLQEEVKKKYGKEISVILDCKTRWCSLHSMVERFIKLEEPLNKVLDDLGLEKLKLSSGEIQLLRDIVAALEPFKVATEFLCKRKCNLVEAEDIIQFTAAKLRTIDSELSRNLLLSLETRYLNRRNSNLVSLAKFFENPDRLSDTADTYKMPSKTTITKNAKALQQRIFPDYTETSTLTCKAETEEEVKITSVTSMAKQLADFLKQQSSGKSSEVQDTFSKEIGLFIAGKKQTAELQLLHQALQAVPPTSVEAERVFSAGGLYLTKLRSNMSDMTLDKLIFLKLFFALKNEHIF